MRNTRLYFGHVSVASALLLAFSLTGAFQVGGAGTARAEAQVSDDVALTPLPGYAATGVATLSWKGNGTWSLVLRMSGLGPGGAHATALRLGTCDVPEEAVLALSELGADSQGNAIATTAIKAPRTVLPATPLVVTVQATQELTSASVACGVLALPNATERVPLATGFGIDYDPFWAFYRSRGEVQALGFPISRQFPFDGCTTQFFQRLVLQQCGDSAEVTILNLLDPDLMPFTHVNGSTFPGPDEGLKAETPQPDDPDYATAILDFVRSNAPDDWDGQPVQFGQSFFSTVTPEMAGTDDPGILGLLDLEVWGPPTSRPQRDPHNPGFIYQRFQRGIMHFDAATGETGAILMADWFKTLFTSENLPTDLQEEARSSRFFRQLCPERVNWICRPSDLPNTDLTWAFERE